MRKKGDDVVEVRSFGLPLLPLHTWLRRAREASTGCWVRRRRRTVYSLPDLDECAPSLRACVEIQKL